MHRASRSASGASRWRSAIKTCASPSRSITRRRPAWPRFRAACGPRSREFDTQVASVAGRFEEANSRIARVTAPIAASFGQLRSHVRALGEETGVNRIAEGFAGVAEHVKRAHEAVADFLKPIGALTAFASFGGIAEAVKASAERGEELSLQSRATGLDVTALAGFQYGANIANISNEQSTRALEYLNRNRGDVLAGRGSKDLKEVLGEVGVTAGMSPAAAMGVIEDRLKTLLDAHQTAAASRIAGTLFGQRSGVALLPFLGQGSQHISELAAEAAKHGQAPSAQWAAQGAAFQENFKQMSAAVTGLGMAISGGLFPVLTPIIASMTKWVDANRQWIATHLAAAVQSLADGFRSIDWASIGAGLRQIAEYAAAASRWLGFRRTLALIAGIKFAGAIMEFGRLAAAIALTAARLVIFPVAAFVASLATLIPSIAGARDAFLALDLATAANPLGAAVAAAALLAVAAYEVWQHWDPIRSFFKRLWDDIVGYFKTGWKRYRPDHQYDRQCRGPDRRLARRRPGRRRQVHHAAPAAPGALSSGRPHSPSSSSPRPRAGASIEPHAVAMVANALVESSLNASAPGGGLFQWSDPSRNAAMRAALGSRAGDAIAEFDYAIAEMRRRDPSWFDRSSNLTNSFRDELEEPKTPFDRRAVQRGGEFGKSPRARSTSRCVLITATRRPAQPRP